MPPKKKPATNGYKLADPLPVGEKLEDLFKKSWILGPSIGKGGFGVIYSAKDSSSKKDYPYVIKIEPHSNGPLFVEINFYIRNAKEKEVSEFKEANNLKTFGMPIYIGSGSHEFNNEKYRFVVMEKFGTDLWKLFLENKSKFPSTTIFRIAVQILDVLEYIHKHGYVHADIKGANILMGTSKETENKQVYLVDFGLACKYNTAAEFKANPKKAHDGTIEYLSRDAHKGVQTRRGDLEILAYNMIQWMGCTLPWEKSIGNANKVHQLKEEHMESASKLLNACFGNKKYPDALEEYVDYLLTLEFDSEPDYSKIRDIFVQGIKSEGGKLDGPLIFSTTAPKRRSSGRPSLVLKKAKITKIPARKTPSAETIRPNKRLAASKPTIIDDPKTPKRKKAPAKRKVVITKTVDQKVDDEEQLPSTSSSTEKENYTASMKEIMKKMKDKTVGKAKVAKVVENDGEDGMEGYTASMREVKLKQMARKNGKKLLALPNDVEGNELKVTKSRKK